MIRSRHVLASLLPLGLLLAAGCGRHAEASSTAAAGRPVVNVVTARRQDLSQTLTVQAEFRPFQEVELHAKVAGYLQSIPVDFGDQVKAGQLLATLEVPELADELSHAEAALRRAQADFDEARLESNRLKSVGRGHPDLLAQQDLDVAAAKESMAQANVAAAKAEADKYRTLFAYTKLTAPFAGVITQRYADPGALIQAGTTSSSSGPIVRLSQNDRLRLDFPVSVSYAGTLAVGDPIEVSWDGGRRSARIARFTRRISTDTRTMEVEAEIPNPDLRLIPGMYATVTLTTARRANALAVPVLAVTTGPKPSAWVVGSGDRLEERPVRLGMETPDEYEVLSGLAAGDRVVVSSRAGLRSGETVDAHSSPALLP